MVVVKDLSRFSRDYIGEGRYIKKVFPQLNVRFISVLDQFDSLTATSTDINLLIPVKNFVNDNYSKDISMKVRGNMDAMRKEGINVSPQQTYGYKWSEGTKITIIDEKAARVVRKIFEWKMTGSSNQQKL